MNTTVQYLSQSFPINSKEFLRPGMMWASVSGRSRLWWHKANDARFLLVAAPTRIFGACGLITDQGDPFPR